MKLLFLYILSIFSFHYFVQKSLSVEVFCYKQFKGSKAVTFVLELTNKTENEILLPHSLETSPEHIPGIDIGFKVSDENRNETGPDHIEWIRTNNKNPLEILFPADKRLIEVIIPSSFFPQKGMYKVKFFFHQEKYIPTSKRIDTEWLSIEIK